MPQARTPGLSADSRALLPAFASLAFASFACGFVALAFTLLALSSFFRRRFAFSGFARGLGGGLGGGLSTC